jgi:hypothetical protein
LHRSFALESIRRYFEVYFPFVSFKKTGFFRRRIYIVLADEQKTLWTLPVTLDRSVNPAMTAALAIRDLRHQLALCEAQDYYAGMEVLETAYALPARQEVRC